MLHNEENCLSSWLVYKPILFVTMEYSIKPAQIQRPIILLGKRELIVLHELYSCSAAFSLSVDGWSVIEISCSYTYP